jgi:hypothetical protein
MYVEFDDERGEVRAGGARTAFASAGRAGELRLGGRSGPIVRPVSFGERGRAGAAALTATDPEEALCAALRRAALAPGSGVDPELIDVVLLALAGGDEEGAPPFAEAALLVLRSTGGELASLLSAPAIEVDRLATALSAGGDDGWTRVAFAPVADELAAVRSHLAGALLARAAPVEGTFLRPADRQTARRARAIAGDGANAARGDVATRRDELVAPGDRPVAPRGGPGGARARDHVTGRHDVAVENDVVGAGGGHDLVARDAGGGGHEVAARGRRGLAGGSDATGAAGGHDLGAAGGHDLGAAGGHDLGAAGGHDLVGGRDELVAPGARDVAAGRDDVVAGGRHDSEPLVAPAATTARIEAGASWPAATAAAGMPRLGRRLEPAPAATLVPRARGDAIELDVAEALARALHDEADLRGVDR